MKKIGVRNKTSIENDILELFNLKEQKKMLDIRESELKERISSYVTSNVKPDSKNNYSYFATSPTGSTIVFQRQARKSVSLNTENALKLLKKKRLVEAIIYEDVIAPEVTNDQIVDALRDTKYNDYIDSIEAVDEITLEELIKDGKITEEEFEKMCDIKVNYAVICKEEKPKEE